LELQTGTILESHGIVFFEERFASIGPLGRRGPEHVYPAAVTPSQNRPRYEAGQRPSEAYFELDDPSASRSSPETLPPAPPLDLDAPVEFESLEEAASEETSDEAIDASLPPARASSLGDLLRRAFRR
jgi:hypothetical protein